MKTILKPLALAFMIIFLALTSAPSADGIKYEALFEKDLILFFKVDDLSALREKSKNASWQKLLQDKEVVDFLEKPAAELQKRIDALNTDLAEKLGMEFKIEDLSEFIPESFAFAVEKPRKGVFLSEKDFSCVLVARMNQADARGERLSAIIDAFINSEEGKLMRREKEIAGETVYGVFRVKDSGAENLLTYAFVDGYLVVGNKLGGVRRLVTALKQGREDNFGQSGKYQRLVKLAGDKVDYLSYLDLENILAAVPRPERPAAPEAAQGAPVVTPRPSPPDPDKIIEALGFANLKFLGGWNYLDEKGEGLFHAYLYAPGEKSGILKLLAAGAAPMPVPDFLSSSAFVHEAFRIPLRQAYDVLLEIAEKIQPGASMLISMGLASGQEKLGVNLVEQILAPLGSEVSISFVLPEDQDAAVAGRPPAMAGVETTNLLLLSVEVKDPQLLESGLGAMIAKLKADGKVVEELEEYGNSAIHSFAPANTKPMLGLPVPCYAIIGDRLFFALAVDTLKAVIAQTQRQQNSLKDLPLCRLAQERLTAEAAEYPGPDEAIGLVCLNKGPYFGWYSTQLKMAISMMVRFQQAQQARREAAQNQVKAGGEAPQPPIQPVPKDLFWTEVGKFIDFDYWPGTEVFERYLGFSLMRTRFVEDGILMEGVSVPNPNPPKVPSGAAEVF